MNTELVMKMKMEGHRQRFLPLGRQSVSETDSGVWERSKSSHDLVPVNHTEGSFEDGAGSFRGRRMTVQRTGSLKGRPEHNRWWRPRSRQVEACE